MRLQAAVGVGILVLMISPGFWVALQYILQSW
jgi:hypothetical protein